MMAGRIAAALDWHPVPGGKVVRAFLTNNNARTGGDMG